MKGLSKKTALICIVVLFYCLIVSLLPSCAQLFESDKHTGASSISLTLPNARRSLGDDSSLAAHHSPELLVQFYEATFLQNGVSRSVVRGAPGETINSGELPEGYYDIEVNAYDYAGMVIGYGKEKKVLVTDGAITTVTITLTEITQKEASEEAEENIDEGIVLYVTAGTSGGDGSQASPFGSVQDAIESMNDNTATYTVRISGTIEDTITISPSVVAAKIILKGNGTNSTVLRGPTGNTARVITITSDTIDTVIEELTITNNYSSASSSITNGSGGISIYTSKTVTMNNVDIKNCYVDGTTNGGGISINQGTLTMNNCNVTGNRAPIGGGLYIMGTVVFTGEISGNSTAESTNVYIGTGGSLMYNGVTQSSGTPF